MRVMVGLVVALAFGPASAVAAVPTLDLVSGRGTLDDGRSFDYYVAEPVTGYNATVKFSLSGGPAGSYSWEATPRCMNVAGDRATLGFFIDSGSAGSQDLSGQGVRLWVQHQNARGTAYYRILGRGEPISCPDPRPGPDPALTAIGYFGTTNIFDGQPRIPAGSDSVAGSAQACAGRDFNGTCSDEVDISLDVASGPGGQDPTGVVYSDYDGPTPTSSSDIQAAVTCLSVRNNVAIVGVTGSRVRAGERNTELAGLIRITDGGGPDTGGDNFEFAIQEGPENGPVLRGPSNCSTFPGPFPAPAGAPTFTNEKGNVVVTDSQPPSTYAQCRQAGWVQYRFASHAACIAYVHQRGREACIFERSAHGFAAFWAKYGLGPNQRFAMRHCVRIRTGW